MICAEAKQEKEPKKHRQPEWRAQKLGVFPWNAISYAVLHRYETESEAGQEKDNIAIVNVGVMRLAMAMTLVSSKQRVTHFTVYEMPWSRKKK